MIGNCDACKVVDVHVHSDHRIPKMWDGENCDRNRHDLCIGCHERKTWIENKFRMKPFTEDAHAEWFALAFPEPVPDGIGAYVNAWYQATGKSVEQHPFVVEFRRLIAVEQALLDRQLKQSTDMIIGAFRQTTAEMIDGDYYTGSDESYERL